VVGVCFFLFPVVGGWGGCFVQEGGGWAGCLFPKGFMGMPFFFFFWGGGWFAWFSVCSFGFDVSLSFLCWAFLCLFCHCAGVRG